MNPLSPGTVVGNYEIGDILSQSGGMSIVYAARRCGALNLDYDLAVKEGKPREWGERDGLFVRAPDNRRQEFDWIKSRMRDEARFLRANIVKHPNIIGVLDWFDANNTVYIVMERLAFSLRRWVLKDGPQGQRQVLGWLMPILDALVACEQEGCHHLDISPENIMFRNDGSPVLIDFGFAKFPDKPRSRASKLAMTDGYSAPEKYSTSSRDLDAKADVYSIGAVINFALTGEAPHDKFKRLDHADDIGLSEIARTERERRSCRDFLAVVDRAFSYVKTRRYPTIATLKAEVVRCLAAHESASGPPVGPERAEIESGPGASKPAIRKVARRTIHGGDRRRRMTMILILLLMIFMSLALFLVFDWNSP